MTLFLQEQKLSQTSTASGFDPAHLESGKHLARKTLDGLLKVERKSDQMKDGKTSKDWRKVLVNTVDLSDQKVKGELNVILNPIMDDIFLQWLCIIH